MKILRIVFWGLVALILVVLGLANRDLVELRALPEPLANLARVSPDVVLPLFVVIFIGVALGLLIGFLWEWLRERRYRSEARHRAREIERLEREVERLRAEKHEGRDEVLALVDTPSRR